MGKKITEKPAALGVSVRIAEGLRDRAKVYAAQKKTTILAVLNDAVEEYLRKRGA